LRLTFYDKRRYGLSIAKNKNATSNHVGKVAILYNFFLGQLLAVRQSWQAIGHFTSMAIIQFPGEASFPYLGCISFHKLNPT